MNNPRQVNDKDALADLLYLCRPDKEGISEPLMLYTSAIGRCSIRVEPTRRGPIINGVPDPNVAWSAYASVYDVRVDLYGCGPTPRAAVECLLRDVERNIARLAQGNSTACKTCKTCKGVGGWTSGASDPGTTCPACVGTGVISGG